MKTTILRAGAFCLLCVCSTAGALPLGPYDEVFVFGDSISDNGNVALTIPTRTEDPYTVLITNALVPAAPYDVSDNFSNGPVWTDLIGLTPSLIGGTNYAFGGAESGSLPPLPDDTDIGISIGNQVAMFGLATGGNAPTDALYVVAPIGNDIRRALQAYLGVWLPTGNATAAEAFASGIVMAAVDNVESVIRQLEGFGSENFVVSNAADIGLTPSVRLLDTIVDVDRITDLTAIATDIAEDYADKLGQMLDSLVQELAIGLARLDVFGLINDISQNPGNYGLTNVEDPCIMPGIGACTNPDDFLFWDGIHLTGAGQAILERAVRSAAPEPGTLAMLALGLLGFGLIRRTRKSTPPQRPMTEEHSQPPFREDSQAANARSHAATDQD